MHPSERLHDDTSRRPLPFPSWRRRPPPSWWLRRDRRCHQSSSATLNRIFLFDDWDPTRVPNCQIFSTEKDLFHYLWDFGPSIGSTSANHSPLGEPWPQIVLMGPTWSIFWESQIKLVAASHQLDGKLNFTYFCKNIGQIMLMLDKYIYQRPTWLKCGRFHMLA